jgi:hypothetical protein
MKRLRRFGSWVVTSSADPLRYSLALRGIGGLIVAKLMTIATTLCGVGIACIGLDVGFLNAILEFVVKAVEYGLYAVAAYATLFGMGRKIYHSRWAHYAA